MDARTNVGSPMTRPQKAASIIAALTLLALGLFTLDDFLPAIVWAVIFAIAIWPLYSRAVRRWPRREHVALPLLFTLLVALVFILPLAFVAVPLGHDGQDIVRWVNQARHTGVPVPSFVSNMPFASHLVPLWQQNLSDPRQASELLGRAFQGRFVSMGGHVGSQVLHRLVLFGFTLLTLFFLFRNGEHLNLRLLMASRRAFGPPGETVGRQIVASVHGTVDGLVLVGLGEGVLLGIVYGLTGVPHPTIFGLFSAILSMVPFGAAIAFWLAGGVLLVMGHTAGAVIVVAVGLLITFVADHFVRPTLIGNATRLPFLWVLFGILGGIEAWGLLGLFVGPAIMAALILLWREWVGDQEGPISPA